LVKLRVGVIFGGRSGEHEVSVLSAGSVLRAIDPERYEIVPIGITKEGRWMPGVSPLPMIEKKELQVQAIGSGNGKEEGSAAALSMLANDHGQILAGLRDRVDLVFPVLHGPYGEDGTLQGLLELAGIPYVGCGVLAAAAGMDKAIMKDLFRQKRIPVGDFQVYLRKDFKQNMTWILQEIETGLGYPCFVKPANLGSSVGISKAHDHKELEQALNFAAEYDRKIIVEKMMIGREVECAVLGNDEPLASVVGEILPGAEFYDYEAKYVLNNSKLIIPAEIPPELAARVQDYAIQGFKAIDGAGLGRVDFFVQPETGVIFINEINTMPGFTQISMYPKLWEASNISYKELIDRLIQLALERYNDKMKNRVG
jgi:D-alanine-D-alanine ligase